jgi:hypothetical protein
LRASGLVISPPLPVPTFLYPALHHFPEDAAVDEADRIDPQRGEDLRGTRRVYLHAAQILFGQTVPEGAADLV